MVNVRDINKFLNIIFLSGVGAPGEDPVLTLQQATNAAGAGAVALSLKRVFYKVGAPAFSATNDKFIEDTAATPETPAVSYDTDPINGAENNLMVAVQVRPIDLLDGYSYVRMQIADVGATPQLGMVLYAASASAYSGRTVPSILA